MHEWIITQRPQTDIVKTSIRWIHPFYPMFSSNNLHKTNFRLVFFLLSLSPPTPTIFQAPHYLFSALLQSSTRVASRHFSIYLLLLPVKKEHIHSNNIMLRRIATLLTVVCVLTPNYIQKLLPSHLFFIFESYFWCKFISLRKISWRINYSIKDH